MTHHILARSQEVRPSPHGVELLVVAHEAIALPGTPGWLTGETPEEQGLETGMPNLPRDLRLPPLRSRTVRVRVRVLGPDTVRVTVADPGHRLWSEDDRWPGIMTSAVNGPVAASVSADGDRVQVRFGDSELEVRTSSFALALRRGGTTLLRTGERLRQVAGFPMAPPMMLSDEASTLHLEMGHDERILGFGEQFSRLVKNGQRLVLTVEDALGTGTGLAYKPVPVWHSTAGYSAFLNTGATVTADVGHDRPSVLGVTVGADALDLVLFTAPGLADRLRDYTALTGTAARPELFAFGYWMGRCRYHSRAEMLEVADRMRSERVPADVLHLDPDWLVVDRLNTDYEWNAARFGDRKEFIAALCDRGFRLSLWELPYLDPVSPLFPEAERGGHLLRREDGSLAEVRGTPTPDGRMRALYDYTRPETVDWLTEKNRPFFDDGLAVIKTDFGEGCPADAVAADGTPPAYVHNLFPLRYNGAVWEMSRRLGRERPLVWGRSGWAGSQRYPGQWGGDAESTVVGMQATLRGGLSYALSAPGLWSHDIGGFYGPELTPELYVRWTQFGAFSPLMRAHGLRPREPWTFGSEALRICREWIRLRYSLLPYIWQVAGEVEAQGLPFIRPLALHHPDDPVAIDIDDQYLFGRDLLVAPVFDDGPHPVERIVYLPAGVWYDFATEERIEGPARVRRRVSLDEMPVFVREGALIPRVEVDDSVTCADDLRGRPWVLHLWGAVAAPAVAALVGFDGEEPRVSGRVVHGRQDGVRADQGDPAVVRAERAGR